MLCVSLCLVGCRFTAVNEYTAHSLGVIWRVATAVWKAPAAEHFSAMLPRITGSALYCESLMTRTGHSAYLELPFWQQPIKFKFIFICPSRGGPPILLNGMRKFHETSVWNERAKPYNVPCKKSVPCLNVDLKNHEWLTRKHPDPWKSGQCNRGLFDKQLNPIAWKGVKGYPLLARLRVRIYHLISSLGSKPIQSPARRYGISARNARILPCVGENFHQ